ncbi:HesB/IscA family protein [Alkalinema pantanalense CENA528]|uniref:HesB/IscA family protein n=1 Tax=Alkalinema pantanalense TaxID=1620705 RepID=UPI003D6DE310
MIHLSAAALAEVKRIRQRQFPTASYLRITAEAGGCNGWIYRLAWCNHRESDDVEFPCSNITVVVAASQLSYLESLTIDYAEDLMGGNFHFDNPIATAVCGCGFSFAVDQLS